MFWANCSGDALVMSPALLTKYLDAAKGIAAHAVLLPDGIRFSNHTTRRDWATEVLEQIRTVYGTYSDSGIGTKVSLQGLADDSSLQIYETRRKIESGCDRDGDKSGYLL